MSTIPVPPTKQIEKTISLDVTQIGTKADEEKFREAKIKEVSETALLTYLRGRIFVVNYKKKYQVQSRYIIEESLELAKRKFESYCDRWGLKCISVHPWFMNLEHKPAEERNYSYDVE